MYGNTRCVTYDELVGVILSKPNYDKKVREGKLRRLSRGGNGNKARFCYDLLPDDLRAQYDAAHPEAVQKMQEELLKLTVSDMIQDDPAAVRYYRDTYKLRDGSSLTDKKQAEYVLNAQVMNEMIRIAEETRATHSKSGYRHRSIEWQAALETCEELRSIFKHTLPTNPSRIREKYNRYRKEGYIALVSGKVGNQNTRKIGTAEARLLLKLKRSRFPVYTDSQIFEEFNRQAIERKFKPLKSPTSVRNFLNEPSVMPLWYAAVYGELKWKKKYSALLKTEMPSFRDSLWYGDGTKLNLYYRDEKGKMCTTQVYEVIDAYSEMLLGYDISPTEKFDNQYRAYRMAVETAKVKPYEIVTDNQGGHGKLAAEGFFNKICKLHKNTAPYSPQSKTIEALFGRFQQQIIHKIWHFTGQNITSVKKNSRPNLEFIEANKHALPTLEEVKELYAELRREWNAAAHPSTGLARIDMYTESTNPRTVPVTELDKILMFWLKSQKPVTYTNKGIEITINKQTYEYEVYGADGLRDEHFALKNTGRPFYIFYDPEDMTLVELWRQTADGLVLEAQATPKVSIHRNTQERVNNEDLYMRRQLESNMETRAAIHLAMEEFELEELIAAEYHGMNTPKPKGISEKAMDGYRKKMKRGELSAPVKIPEAVVENTEVHIPQTVGEWEKAISNETYDEIDIYSKYI